VTSPGLRANATTVSFFAGSLRQLSCAFSPAAIDVGGTSTAAVQLRDVFGNLVESAELPVLTFVRASGSATALIGEAARPFGSGAALFTVRGGTGPGTDVYTAILGETAESSCAIAVRPP
jgi:hypothetical protein